MHPQVCLQGLAARCSGSPPWRLQLRGCQRIPGGLGCATRRRSQDWRGGGTAPIRHCRCLPRACSPLGEAVPCRGSLGPHPGGSLGVRCRGTTTPKAHQGRRCAQWGHGPAALGDTQGPGAGQTAANHGAHDLPGTCNTAMQARHRTLKPEGVVKGRMVGEPGRWVAAREEAPTGPTTFEDKTTTYTPSNTQRKEARTCATAPMAATPRVTCRLCNTSVLHKASAECTLCPSAASDPWAATGLSRDQPSSAPTPLPAARSAHAASHAHL